MVDQTPSRRSRLIVTACIELICFAIVWRLIEAGDPANSLHTSALAWAFTFAIATAGAFFGVDWWERAKSAKG